MMAIETISRTSIKPKWFEVAAGRLSRPVSAASLAVFRILFGLVMAAAMVRLLAKGWVKTLYLDPMFHFPWFSWIHPWPGSWMYVHVTLLAVCALGIALGICYRGCTFCFCLGFLHLELLDRTAYLNHYYLISLLAGLLLFLPAQRQWSVWAWRRPQLAGGDVPTWTIWLLRFQLGVVYIFSGLAKLNADWLFAAEPLRIWLGAQSDLPWVGAWLAEPWMAYAASWIGAVFDLSIPFLLLTPASRVTAYAAVLLFHVATSILFPIGMFPWIMISTTLIYFPPYWPMQLLFRAKPTGSARPVMECEAWSRTIRGRAAFLCGLVYCVAQVLIPLRSWLYPQQGAWDGRGFNFSWRVMLVEKTGNADFFAVDPITGVREAIPLDPYITSRQAMMMAQDPYLIRALAEYLSDHYTVGTKSGWEIQVDAFATLNGRAGQRLVQPHIDVARSLPGEWIVPLQPAP